MEHRPSGFACVQSGFDYEATVSERRQSGSFFVDPCFASANLRSSHVDPRFVRERSRWSHRRRLTARRKRRFADGRSRSLNAKIGGDERTSGSFI
jgi:hypothetical protein